MNYLFPLNLVLILALCGLAVHTAHAAECDTASREGLLVLANGGVIEGVITREGAYYRVLLPKGKLQVRVDQVDFNCQNIEEAYVRRRARMISKSSSVEGHLDMARWCMQQGLLAHAEAEIGEARRLDSHHRQITFVERLLSQRRELVHRRQRSTIKDKQFLTAGAMVERTRPPVADVPGWARTEFIKRVQPMLVSSCATAGCHVPSSTQRFKIDRTALDGVGNPELFQQNLAAVMEMVNLAEPEDSRLLSMGAADHGTVGVVESLPLTSYQLEILRSWITQLALEESPRENEPGPRIAQVVIGVNSSEQQKLVPIQPAQASSDPFDPTAFNSADNSTVEDPANSEKATQSEVPARSAQE